MYKCRGFFSLNLQEIKLFLSKGSFCIKEGNVKVQASLTPSYMQGICLIRVM